MPVTAPRPSPTTATGVTPEAVLIADQVSKTFPPSRRGAPAIPVLHTVSLRVAPGEFLAIVGPSGSGKSTLLYCLSGLEPLSGGTVRLLGYDLARLGRNGRAKLRRDHVGFIFQNLNLIGSLTATQNVELPARLAHKNVDSGHVNAILDHVGLHERGTFHPAQLSGGEQQRVAIARVLADRPDLVFADEPTGSLDSATGRVVTSMLREAATAGTAVIMVTHNLELACLADRAVVLHDGHLRYQLHHPAPEDLLQALADGQK